MPGPVFTAQPLGIKPAAGYRGSSELPVFETICKIAGDSISGSIRVLEADLLLFRVGVVQKVAGLSVSRMRVAIGSVIVRSVTVGTSSRIWSGVSLRSGHVGMDSVG